MLFAFCFWLFASQPKYGRQASIAIKDDELMLISEPEGTGEQANGQKQVAKNTMSIRMILLLIILF